MTFNLNKLGLSKKINYIMVLINIIIFCTMSYTLISNTIKEYNQGKNLIKQIEIDEIETAKQSLKNVVDLAINSIKEVHEYFDDKEIAKDIIRSTKYGKNNQSYLWIQTLDKEPIMVMHPKATSLEGTNLSQVSDLNKLDNLHYQGNDYKIDSIFVKNNIKNTKLFSEMNKKVLESKTSDGYVEYFWPKPEEDTKKGYQKLAYVKAYKGWNWVIGTEMYMDELVEKILAQKQEVKKSFQKTILKVIFVLCILIVLNIMGFIIIRKNLDPINTLTTALKEISKGNLRFKVDENMNTEDEVGEMILATGKMANNMANLIQTIKESSEKVANLSIELADSANQTKETSTQISTAITSVAEGAGNQVASVTSAIELMSNMLLSIKKVEDGAILQTQTLEKTAGTAKENDLEMQNLSESAVTELKAVEEATKLIEQMAEAISQVTDEATSVSQNSQQTAQTAQEGDQIISNTVTGMEKIREAVLNSAEKIDTLGKRSSQIGDIIGVIDDIAEQTNLLALNAAIEAARAGEHGKGFAVVADEVRKLAERSSKATKEIASLIQAIQKDTEEAVKSMEVGTDEVERGSQLAYKTKEALKNIIDAISGTVDQIQNITASAEEMSASSSKVVNNINDIKDIIKNNTERISHVAENSTRIVATTQNVMNVAKNNQKATEEMKSSYQEINISVDNVSAIAEDTSSLAEEVTASTEEMTATMETTAIQTDSLSEMAKVLLNEVNKFDV